MFAFFSFDANAGSGFVSISSLTSSGKTLISFLLLTPSPVIFFSSVSFFSTRPLKSSQTLSSLAAIALPIALRRFIRYLSLLSLSPSLSTSPSSFPTGSKPCFAFAVDLPLYFSDFVGSPYDVISTDDIFGLLRRSAIFARLAILTYELPVFLSVTLTLKVFSSFASVISSSSCGIVLPSASFL